MSDARMVNRRTVTAGTALVIVVAIAASLLLLGRGTGTAPSHSTSPVAYQSSPAPTPTPSPTPTPTPKHLPIGSPADAVVDLAGPIQVGFERVGIWTIKDATLRFTRDGGVSWTKVVMPALAARGSYGAPVIFDAQHIWVLQNDVKSLGEGQWAVSLSVNRTSDGGASWKATKITGNFDGCWYKLRSFDAAHGMLVSTCSNLNGQTTIYRTADGGATWVPDHPVATFFADFTIVSPTALFLSVYSPAVMGCGDWCQPVLRASTDAGASWTPVSLPGVPPKVSESVGAEGPPTFLDESTGFIAVEQQGTGDYLTGSTQVFGTTDGGKTWSPTGTPAPIWINVMSFVDAKHWVGSAGEPAKVLYATDDGGQTWNRLDLPALTLPNRQLWFVTPQEGAALLYNQEARATPLYLTTDGGQTWTPAVFGD